jgi:hypothetical protein
VRDPRDGKEYGHQRRHRSRPSSILVHSGSALQAECQIRAPQGKRKRTTKLCTAFLEPLALVVTLLRAALALDWTRGPGSGTCARSASDPSCSPRPVLNGAAQHHHTQAGR